MIEQAAYMGQPADQGELSSDTTTHEAGEVR